MPSTSSGGRAERATPFDKLRVTGLRCSEFLQRADEERVLRTYADSETDQAVLAQDRIIGKRSNDAAVFSDQRFPQPFGIGAERTDVAEEKVRSCGENSRAATFENSCEASTF